MEQIQVTDLALENIRDLRLEYGEASWGLRFGLSGGGCSGYKYVLEFEDVAVEGDLVFGIWGCEGLCESRTHGETQKLHH